MTQFFTQYSDIIIRLFLAVVFGMLIGAERLLVHKEAGMKTHALVAMGSALFIIISEIIVVRYAKLGIIGLDPIRMATQIVVGIGFLGAGSIILQGSRLRGLTTAGGLWVTAGIGMAVGFGLLGLATIATFFILLILIIMNVIEKPLRKISNKNFREEQIDN